MICHKSDFDSIEKTVDVLKREGVVIIPTDTVYGFSGVVDFTKNKIQKIKGRDENKPFIQLISKPEDILAISKDKIPEKLLKYWPGPLTIIVESVNGGTVAVRCPGDLWLRQIIEQTGVIYSTSVNRSGFPVLEDVDSIIQEFQNDVELIVSDGDKYNSVPSTIVSFVKSEFKVIRQGSLIVDL